MLICIPSAQLICPHGMEKDRCADSLLLSLRRCSWTLYPVNTSSFTEAKMPGCDMSTEARDEHPGTSSIFLTVHTVTATSIYPHTINQQPGFVNCIFDQIFMSWPFHRVFSELFIFEKCRGKGSLQKKKINCVEIFHNGGGQAQSTLFWKKQSWS